MKFQPKQFSLSYYSVAFFRFGVNVHLSNFAHLIYLVFFRKSSFIEKCYLHHNICCCLPKPWFFPNMNHSFVFWNQSINFWSQSKVALFSFIFFNVLKILKWVFLYWEVSKTIFEHFLIESIWKPSLPSSSFFNNTIN